MATTKATEAEVKEVKKTTRSAAKTAETIEAKAEEVTTEAVSSAKQKMEEAKQKLGETKEKMEAATNQATSMVRDMAYAYVGTVAKSIDAFETLMTQFKEDRDAMFKDYVNSGESFVTTYRGKVAEQTANLKKAVTPKKEEAAEA
jgi:hypothetical protein